LGHVCWPAAVAAFAAGLLLLLLLLLDLSADASSS
jgi:hypothetical protein